MTRPELRPQVRFSRRAHREDGSLWTTVPKITRKLKSRRKNKAARKARSK